MSRCYLCDRILSDEDQRIIYRLECDLARRGKSIDKWDEICSFCRYEDKLDESVDTDGLMLYTVITDDSNEW